MAIGNLGAAGAPLRILFGLGVTRERTDGQLLERFATDRGEAGSLAFAALVERHGPMVYRVCRGILPDEADAQDAFQATFLVLVRKARGLWVRDSLAPWLHRVAHQTATCSRIRSARRSRLDREAAAMRAQTRTEPDDDLARILHEEINRLPERYRVPVILCDLEGRTHEQAARHLGWPVGTVKSRQSRGRERLRDRLKRRGIAPGGALVAALAASSEGAVPAILMRETTLLAARFVASRAIAPGAVASLTRETVRSLTMTRWLKIASIALALGATGTGLSAFAQKEKDGPRDDPAPKAVPGADSPTVTVRRGKFSMHLRERGSLEAAETHDIINVVEGQTTIISIKPEGSYVKKGDVVAELDSSSLRDQLVNQGIATRRAKADLENAEKTRQVAEIRARELAEGSIPQHRQALKTAIEATEQDIKRAESYLSRVEAARRRMKEAIAAREEAGLTPADILADAEMDDRAERAESAVRREKASLADARAKLDLFEKFDRESETLTRTVEVNKALSDELSRQATYELEKSKEQKLRKQIVACTLLAPTDGIIVYAYDPRQPAAQDRIEEGATVRERQKIVSIPNLSAMRANIKVHEAMVDRVQTGMPVKIKVDAFPGQELTGVVTTIYPLPDPGPFVASVPKLYTTLVKVADGPKGLRPGMTTQADILLGEIDDAISIPNKAVVGLDSKWQVAVKGPDGAFDWREVTPGATDGENVEIRSGLKSGEAVALDPRSLLTDDQKTRLRPPGRNRAESK